MHDFAAVTIKHRKSDNTFEESTLQQLLFSGKTQGVCHKTNESVSENYLGLSTVNKRQWFLFIIFGLDRTQITKALEMCWNN